MKVKGGVRVDAVDGPAARAGVREGDVILSIDNNEVTNAKQFESIVGKLDKTKPISVLVRRSDWVNYVVIRPIAMRHVDCRAQVFPSRETWLGGGVSPNCRLTSRDLRLDGVCVCSLRLTSFANCSGVDSQSRGCYLHLPLSDAALFELLQKYPHSVHSHLWISCG